MKWPKISVVTPSYNQGQFIEQTLQSVLNQRYPNLELIVQDGGSTDETVAILKKYRSKIHYQSEKDKGQTDAINKGLKKATGNIVCYLNSDDLLLSGSLQTVARYFTNHPDIAWVTGQCAIIDADGRPIRSLVKRYKDWWLARYGYGSLLTLNYISQPATFWRRSMLKDIGLLDSTLNYVMDYDYWLRLGKRSAPAVLNQPLATFRIHRGSKTMQGFSTQLREQYMVAKRHTKNSLILGLHRLHGLGVGIIYSLLR